MRKSIFKTIGLVAAMVSCIGMTVFAEPSVSASTVVTGVVEATDAAGKKASVTVVPTENEEAAADIKKESTLKTVLGNKYNANYKVVDVKDIKAEGDVQWPVSITFSVTGVTANTKGVVAQYVNGRWAVIDVKMGNGTITGTFDSVGTLAFILDTTTLQSGTASSPQTSASAAALAGVVGISAAAGAVLLKKKEK